MKKTIGLKSQEGSLVVYCLALLIVGGCLSKH